MKLSDLNENDRQLSELLPALGAVGGALAAGAQPVGSAVKTGAQAVGQAAGSAAQGFKAGLAGGSMDPAQAAAAAKERQDQKKQIQDQIKQTQTQLSALQKQLAELG